MSFWRNKKGADDLGIAPANSAVKSNTASHANAAFSFSAAASSSAVSANTAFPSSSPVAQGNLAMAPQSPAGPQVEVPEPSPQAVLIANRFGKLRSVIGAGTTIQGALSFDTPIRIDGTLKGKLTSSSTVIIPEGGMIDGEVFAAEVIVGGRCKGLLSATQRVEVLAGGVLDAAVRTPGLIIQDGAFFEGECEMCERAEVRRGSIDDGIGSQGQFRTQESRAQASTGLLGQKNTLGSNYL